MSVVAVPFCGYSSKVSGSYDVSFLFLKHAKKVLYFKFVNVLGQTSQGGG
jgi:hypothetical protein